MTPSPSFTACPKCHAPLPPSAPRGLCPACLMDAAGMETEVMPAGDAFGAPLDLDTLRRAFPQLDILAPLGAGGMGRVYKVRQPNLDRIAALKVLPPELARDAGWVERFTREARALARLNHPNIVQVFDVGQAAGAPGGMPLCWLLMEYVDGVTLRQVQRTGGLSAREALSLIPKLCDALQYAHEKGVLHRDIKPENILLDSAGTAKIADFGLAKLGGAHPGPTLTVAGARLGTAAYMAPEQIESPADVDHRADIYSLGVVLYELLTGGLPLGRFPAPSEKSGTDPRLDQIVFRTLEKERERRYQAAGDVRTALETVAAGPQPPPLPAQPPLPHAAHGVPIAPQPRIVQTKHPLPAELPPNLPEGTVTKVIYHQRKRSATATEAAGYGCGWILVAPLQLALAVAPGFIPVLWFESISEWNRPGLPDFYPASMPFVAAATGLLAWLAARPFLKLSGLTGREGVKRKALLFLLLALVMWGGIIHEVTNASRSYPNQGAMRTLHFSCLRPPLAAGDTKSPEAALESLWQQRVEAEFGQDSKAIVHPDLNNHEQYPNGRPNPLHRYWNVSVVGSTIPVTDARLTRLAESMIAGLPEVVRSSATMSIDGRVGPRLPGGLSLRREETFALIGIVMTLGGWLAALTRGRPVIHAFAPVLLAVIVTGSHFTPSARRLGSEVVVPLPDPADGVPPPQQAWNKLGELEKSGKDPEAGAVYWWIDACRRLDRTAADMLSKRALTDDEWQKLVGFWEDHHLLSITRDAAPVNAQPLETRFICLVMPVTKTYKASDSRYYSSRYRFEWEDSGGLTQAGQVKLLVTFLEGDAWRVEQKN